MQASSIAPSHPEINLGLRVSRVCVARSRPSSRQSGPPPPASPQPGSRPLLQCPSSQGPCLPSLGSLRRRIHARASQRPLRFRPFSNSSPRSSLPSSAQADSAPTSGRCVETDTPALCLQGHHRLYLQPGLPQIFLYPRILRTKAAKEVLESDQSARLEAVQRRLRLLVAIRGGMAAAAEPDDQETTLVIASGDKSDESSQSVEGGSLPMPNEKDLLADDSTALARIDSHSPGVIGQDLFALPETALLDLSGALPLLAPRPRPGGLLRSLSTASRAWTSAALSFSAKTCTTSFRVSLKQPSADLVIFNVTVHVLERTATLYQTRSSGRAHSARAAPGGQAARAAKEPASVKRCHSSVG